MQTYESQINDLDQHATRARPLLKQLPADRLESLSQSDYFSQVIDHAIDSTVLAGERFTTYVLPVRLAAPSRRPTFAVGVTVPMAKVATSLKKALSAERIVPFARLYSLPHLAQTDFFELLDIGKQAHDYFRVNGARPPAFSVNSNLTTPAAVYGLPFVAITPADKTPTPPKACDIAPVTQAIATLANSQDLALSADQPTLLLAPFTSFMTDFFG